MAETRFASQENLSANDSLQLPGMRPSSSTHDLDSPIFGSFNDSSGNPFAGRAGKSQTNLSVRDSNSSTSTSGTDYQSCSNPSTPDKANSADKLPSISAPATDTVSNVKMSANIANKLNQMSMENLDDLSQSSFEEVESPDEAGPNFQDTVTVGVSPGPVRRVSVNPSLRQVFPYISCLPFENNIVFCFVLSVWDNIVGPQTVYVWKRKSFPSQKTFDGLLDETEGIELAEDSVEIERARSRLKRMSHQLEGRDVSSVSGKEARLQDQRKNNKYNSRKFSAPAGFSEPYSPVHTKKHPHSGSIPKLTSVVLENKYEGDKNICVKENEEAQPTVQSTNEDQPDSRNYPESCADTEENSSATKRVRAPSLANFQTASVDSTNLGDSADGQEMPGSWVCGRSRLRMAAVVRYVTEHSVAVGQVGLTSEKITSSLLVVPHQGIIIVAARFSVLEDECAVPYCLSMVVPLEEYDYFLPLTQPVTTWLITIAASTRLLITKHGLEGGGRVKRKLVELCDVLVALRSASLDQYPLTPAGRPPDDRRLAEIILTSHLQTLGSTVVVADSPNAANKVVMWIAQFSDPADLHISRLCLSYTQWPFHPGLSIQGIVRSATGEVNLSAQKLIQSSRPLTVVDINRGTVKQTGAPDVHARRNSSALHQELLSLWHDLPDVSAPSESLLEPVRGASSLVKRFLHDYDRLSSCDNTVRQNFIKAFLRSLQYTALAIITWTQQEWAVQRRRSGYASLRRALCSIFDLDECDLRILLAQAELLQPGFYTYVMM